MNRADLDIARIRAYIGAVTFEADPDRPATAANHITTWVHVGDDGEPDRARITVHMPLRETRWGSDAYRLLEAMQVKPGTIEAGHDAIEGVARYRSAVVELVVMTGSGVRAIAAAIPKPRDGEVETADPDDVPDRTSVLVDGTEL